MGAKCCRCGYPLELTNHYVVIDDDAYCMECYKLITEFREDTE